MTIVLRILAFCLALIPGLALPPAVAAASLTFGPDEESAGQPLDHIVAVVDDDVISRSELDAALAGAVAQLRQRGTTLPPAEVLERQVLERLIVNKLELRAAEQQGIVVDDQTVNAALNQIARQNNITLSQLRETLEAEGFSFARFRDNIRDELISTRLRQKVVDSRVQVTDQEVDNWLSIARSGRGDQEYHLAHILIGVPEAASAEQLEAAQRKARQVLEQLRQGADFRRLAVSVSDGRQALDGGDLGWVRGEQLPSLFADVVPQLQPGEISDLIRSPSGFHIVQLLETRGAARQPITQTRARQILIRPAAGEPDTEVRLRLERLRERVLSGEDFAELARANSNDPDSAARGGDLGWLSPGDQPPAFAAAMNDLNPGQVSQPFQSDAGWHIVQVLERRQHDSADDVQRAAAREAIARRKADEELEQWLRRLRDEAYVEIRL